ncbi:rhamnose ABC transporter substrate-binding protein [Konateibacter massiliensis]|uniref:rhamnose ABC transporter substrate-binding protein n=1 Tax=Konateibacter massiliensis TaxID=2002841 RepID=UPI000C15A6EA|nr:rhamnose ABC transporter substrate-binding protein [Konateibacter massiliensis]
MKKKLVSVLLCAAMVSTLLAGCGSSSSGTKTTEPSTSTETKDTAATEEKTESTDTATDTATGGGSYAIIVKSAGNPYNQKEIEGFREVIEAQGGSCVVKEPSAATAEAQIAMINELVAQQVDAIAIAGNDVDALQPALTAAKNAGIKISSLDSSVNADSRLVHVNQAGTQIIGQTLMDAILDISGGSGQFAILSATSQATNQNAWIDAMKTVMQDSKYASLELVDIVYGDDEYQKSVDQTQALLSQYPDLKVICAPTTVGIMAAAKVLQDQGVADKVKLTGLGLPSEMADYIGDDDAHSCPYMYLWNPIDIGRLSAYTSIALVNGDITGASGEKFTAGDMGEYEIVAAADNGTEIILGPPFKFEPSNIEEWKEVY